MINAFISRSQHAKEHTRNHEQLGEYSDNVYIHRPTIDRVEVGMMIHVWTSKSGNCKTYKGQVVVGLNESTGDVLVRDFIGGTKECEFWCHVDDVQQVWAPGGKTEGTIARLEAFGGVVKQVINKAKKFEKLN